MLAILALSFTGVLAKSLLHKENIKINYPLLSFIGTCALSLAIGSKSLIGGVIRLLVAAGRICRGLVRAIIVGQL